MYYWSFFPFCRSLYILIMKYLTYTKLSGFDQTSVYWKHVIFLLVSFDLKSLKNSWYIWQYISGWRFLHKLKILRLVLGSVYLQGLSQGWFSINQVYLWLHWISSLFLISKKLKCIELFCLELIFMFLKFILSAAL